MHYVYNRPRRARSRDFHFPGGNEPPFHEDYFDGPGYEPRSDFDDRGWPEDRFYERRARMGSRYVEDWDRPRPLDYQDAPDGYFPEDPIRDFYGNEVFAENHNRGRRAPPPHNYYY